MDNPNEEINIDDNWILVHNIDEAQEAVTLNETENVINYTEDGCKENSQLTHISSNICVLNKNLKECSTKSSLINEQNRIESDVDSDGISVISENSPLSDHSDGDDFESKQIYVKEIAQNDSGSSLSSDNFNDYHALPKEENSVTNLASLNSEKKIDLFDLFLNSSQKQEDHFAENTKFELESNELVTNDEVNELVQPENTIQRIEEDASTVWRFPMSIRKYLNSILIGTILLAVSSIFLEYFIPNQDTSEKLQLYQKKYFNDVNELSESNYEVPSAFMYCKDKHKSDGVLLTQNTQKCLNKIEKRIKWKKDKIEMKKNIKNLETQLKMKENFLIDEKKYLTEKEYKLGIKENLFKNKKKNRNKQKNENEYREDIETNHHIKVTCDKVYNYKNLKQNRYKRKNKLKIHNNDQKVNDEKEKFKDVLKYLSIDTKKRKKKSYKSDSKEKISNLFRNSKEIANNESRKLKSCKANLKNKKCDENILLNQNNNNNTVNGYWIDKVYKGRSELRNKASSGDWYFDRVTYRKKKRDKAKWYFDWMMDRELMRYKRAYGVVY